MNNYEIVNKLIGKINPIGETTTDEERFENLKNYCELAAKMLSDINYIASSYKDSPRFSEKRAAEYAIRFQKTVDI